jgi:hypothetical protein
MPSHLAKGMEIQVMLDKICHLMGPITWGLLTANRGEFLVADYYQEIEMAYNLLSPYLLIMHFLRTLPIGTLVFSKCAN